MLKIKVNQHTGMYNDDREPIYEDVTLELDDVPEGTWALVTYHWHRPYRRSHAWDEDGNPEPCSFERREVISQDGNEIHLITAVHGDVHNPTIFVHWSSQPFGLMTTTGTTDGYDEYIDGHFFQSAREVKFGQLGRLVGRRPYMVKETTGGNARRRWCRLATIAKMVSLTPQQVWEKYQCIFNGEVMYCLVSNNEHLVAVNHLHGDERHEELRDRQVDHLDLYKGRQIPAVDEHIWVHSSWARQVIALEELGWLGTEDFQKANAA